MSFVHMVQIVAESANECDTYLPLCVAEDDGLRDGQCVVQVAQCVQFPLFSLHGHKELLYALQGQLVTATTTHTVTHWVGAHFAKTPQHEKTTVVIL